MRVAGRYPGRGPAYAGVAVLVTISGTAATSTWEAWREARRYPVVQGCQVMESCQVARLRPLPGEHHCSGAAAGGGPPSCCCGGGGGAQHLFVIVAGKRKRHDVVHAERLHFAVPLEAHYSLRAAEKSTLQHAAIFQFQSVGTGSS